MQFNQQTPTQEATATFLLLPDWLGWSKNGYATCINDYPEYACVLAKCFADSMHLNPTEVWSDAPPQPQHNKNKLQLIVVWNHQGKQALNESNPAWLNNLKQRILKQRGLVTIVPTRLALLV